MVIKNNFKMKNNFFKIKKLLKERGSRLWLMIFVAASTLIIFIIWASDLKNLYNRETVSGPEIDFNAIREQSVAEFNENFEKFEVLLEESSVVNEANVDITNISNNNLSNLEPNLEKVILEKIQESSVTPEIIPSEAKEIVTEPINSLRESEESIETLKIRIQELEQKIENN